MTISSAYNPREVEDKWYRIWDERGLFRADPNSSKPAYCIVIPPPNVTGVLTIGHVLNNTIQDILVRRKKMEGYEVLWLPGTDHAGIATQTVVEKALKKEGLIKHRSDLTREEFLKKIWEWKDKHGDIIIQQLKKLGCSCDWSRIVFTMDGLDSRAPKAQINYSQCVREAFVSLYEKGFIYRGRRMVNWCPVSQTALSDEEVVMKEVDGHLWHIKYPLLDEKHKPIPDKHVVVATTRPETMLGDEAVAVNPKDKRYKNLVGRCVLLPIKNKPIPVIADYAVDMKFGTGAVKVTPAHDPADYEMALRHKLPITIVIGQDGTMTENAGEQYEDMDRLECRRAVVANLTEWGFITKVEPYKHNVGFSQRADVPIEPRLSEQWFLKYPAKNKGIKAVKNGGIKFWPDRWIKVYSHWMENLKDWCISRQLWWGHRIPVWYCVGDEKCKLECKKPIVSLTDPKKCPYCGSKNLRQDEDVLDTWFSSWLWPFAAMGWPKKTLELKKFYPTTDLVTGPDIIFFWVARMIMAGFEFMGKKPFDNVYYTGIIRDSLGRKMSKSLGNSPDPLDLIDIYGADGLRFGLMLIAPQGQDILFAQERIEVGRNFCNKLWNATRFVLMNVDERRTTHDARLPLSLADKWISNRMGHTVRDVNTALDKYEFDAAARILYQFVWRDFCDWYVELSKINFSGEILLNVLKTTLALLHPFMPFITEELWQQINPGSNIVTSAYPKPSKSIPYEKDALHLEKIQKVVDAIRNIRGEHNIKPRQKLEAGISSRSKENRELLEANRSYIEHLGWLSSLHISSETSEKSGMAKSIVEGIEIAIPWRGLIDLKSEHARLTKEITRAEAESVLIKNKLANRSFVSKAPPEIVLAQREKLMTVEEKLLKLKDALNKLL